MTKLERWYNFHQLVCVFIQLFLWPKVAHPILTFIYTLMVPKICVAMRSKIIIQYTFFNMGSKLHFGYIQISYHSILDLRDTPPPHSHAIFRNAFLTPAANPPLRVSDMIFEQLLCYWQWKYFSDTTTSLEKGYWVYGQYISTFLWFSISLE